MSKARDDYNHFYSFCTPWQVDNYVKELESEKAELLEALNTTINFLLNDKDGGSLFKVFKNEYDILQKHKTGGQGNE